MDPGWRNLAGGYQQVTRLESRLRKEWEEPVERARRQRTEEARTEWQNKLEAARRRLKNLALSGLVLALILLILLFGFVRPDSAFGAILFTVAALLGAAALLATAQVLSIRGREIPGVDLDLQQRWWQEVCRSGPRKVEKEGDTGELGFLLRLEAELSDEYLAIKGLMVQRSLDADLIVVGPTGLWIFEVKHWRGTIISRDGCWRRVRHYYAQGGRLAFEERDIERPFDGQWLRQKKSVEETLRRRMQSGLIRGGLVFTHPEVVLDLDDSCRAEYGDAEYWVKSMLRAGEAFDFSMKSRLEAIDALVEWAGSVGRLPEKSATHLADDLFESAVASAHSSVRDVSGG